MKLLQIDFPYPGPWGDGLTEKARGLAEDIARADGLRWKIWTENAETGRAGGIYLFEDAASEEAYRTMHMARLEKLDIRDIRAETFDVNEALGRMTRAPSS